MNVVEIIRSIKTDIKKICCQLQRLSATISSIEPSSPLSESIIATGTTTVTIPANRWFMDIAINPTAPETIRIGTTDGGDQVMVDLLFSAGTFTTVVIDRYFSDNSDTLLYISGAIGSVTYKIIIL